jgi:hypothetical protein
MLILINSFFPSKQENRTGQHENGEDLTIDEEGIDVPFPLWAFGIP